MDNFYLHLHSSMLTGFKKIFSNIYERFQFFHRITNISTCFKMLARLIKRLIVFSKEKILLTRLHVYQWRRTLWRLNWFILWLIWKPKIKNKSCVFFYMIGFWEICWTFSLVPYWGNSNINDTSLFLFNEVHIFLFTTAVNLENLLQNRWPFVVWKLTELFCRNKAQFY